MLQTIPDPFDSYGPPKSEDQIFSILAPLTIFNPSTTPSPQATTAEIQQSPSGLSWTSGHEHEASDNSQPSTFEWESTRQDQSAAIPKSVSETTMGWFQNILPRGSSRSSIASASGSSSRSPTRAKSPRRRVDSLKNSLSVINEGHARTGFVFSDNSQDDDILEGPPFGAHSREASTATIRGAEADPSNARPDASHRNSFIGDPVWGSEEPTSPSTIRGEVDTDRVREPDNHYEDSGQQGL